MLSCNNYKTALSRQNLKMPRLTQFKRFKEQIPTNDLKNSRNGTDRLFTYFFVVDTSGNVVDGRFPDAKQDSSGFLKTYLKNVFDKCHWTSAYYNYGKREKLQSVLKLAVYDNPQNKEFDISIRLVYLPEKEKLGDIFEERNLVYRFKIR